MRHSSRHPSLRASLSRLAASRRRLLAAAEPLEARRLLSFSDLQISGAILVDPNPAHPGDSIHVNFTVKNAGEGTAAASTTRVQILRGTTIVLTTNVAEASLLAGASRAESDVFTLSSTIATGSYTANVHLDTTTSAQQGSNITNDEGHTTFTVAAAAKPNLVTAYVTPAALTAHPGDAIALTWKIYNGGTATAAPTTTNVRLGTSQTAVPGTSTTLLSKAAGEIAVSTALDQDGTVTIPTNTAAGTYYLWVIADAAVPPVLSETSTSDNAAHSAAIVITVAEVAKPNLIPASVLASVTAAHAGDTVHVTWRMYNGGTASAAATTTDVRLGTSPTGAPGASTTLLHKATDSIAAQSVIDQDATVTIPVGTAAGTYYLWVVADAAVPPVLTETTTTDNTAHSGAIVITVAEVAKPNLTPTSVTASVTTAHAGDVVHVTWRMYNTGTAAAAATTTDVRLGTSPTGAPGASTTLLHKSTDGIAAQSAIDQDATLTIPAGTAAGTYYFWIIADAAVPPVLTETTTTDNTAHSGAIVITVVEIAKPNLTPTSVAASVTSAHAGDTVHVTWRMYNTGTGVAASTTTDVRFSSSASVAPGASTTVFSKPTDSIAAESAVDQDATVTIPLGTAPGTYYLWVIADAAVPPVLMETSITDNAAHSHAIVVTVAEAAKPNLVPAFVTPDVLSAHPGDSLHLTWQVTNSGSGNAVATTTDVRLGTSESVAPGVSTTLLSKPTDAIASHVVLSQDGTVTIPAGTPAGTYFLWVIADAAVPPVLSETSTTDNAAHSHGIAITVTSTTGKPNLVPTGVHVSATSVIAGTSVGVTWTIANTGTAPAGATTTTIRLGTSETVFPDAVLGTVDTGVIAAGGSLAQSAAVTIPSGTPAGRYFIWIGADIVGVLTQSSTTDDHARSASFAVTASTHDVPLHLAFEHDVAGTIAGEKIEAFTVLVEDPDGNVVTTAKPKVTVVKASGPDAGKLIGTASVTAKNGRAVFSGLSIRIAGTYTLSAVASGESSAVSNAFVISPGVAHTLAFESLPTDQSVASPATVIVDVLDKYGNLATGAAGNVSILLGARPTGATLAGTTTVAIVSGRATFSPLTFSTAGIYSLYAMSDGLKKIASKRFGMH